MLAADHRRKKPRTIPRPHEAAAKRQAQAQAPVELPGGTVLDASGLTTTPDGGQVARGHAAMLAMAVQRGMVQVVAHE